MNKRDTREEDSPLADPVTEAPGGDQQRREPIA